MHTFFLFMIVVMYRENEKIYAEYTKYKLEFAKLF
jgi:hypothetical protein